MAAKLFDVAVNTMARTKTSISRFFIFITILLT
jgi:hypothetical protein